MALYGRPDGLRRLAADAGSADLDCEGVRSREEPGQEDLCGPLYCRLCDVTLNSFQQGHAHYQGRSHSRKLRVFLSGSSGSVSSVTVRQTPVKPATDTDYWKLCNASFSSPEVAQAHYDEKNHDKKVCLSETRKNTNISKWRTRKVGGVRAKKGWKPPAVAAGPYDTLRLRIPRDLAMCVTPSGRFYCSLCNCGAEQESDFRSHLRSKAHKSRESESLYRTESENLSHS